MQLVQTLRQQMTLSGRMLGSLAILGMSSHDLSEHLREMAALNPFLSYRPPRHLGTGGAAFDAAAALAADRPSLLAHVFTQIDLAFGSPADRRLALHFAEALEPSGWLGQPVAAIAAEAGVPEPRAAEVLTVLQGFEPAGLFARDLSECLLLQAREAGLLTWELQAVLENLDLLAEGGTAKLAELCDCDPADVARIAVGLRQFDPKPGLSRSHPLAPVSPPDLIATRGTAGWRVDLNHGTLPGVTVDPARLPSGSGDPAARAFRRKALAEARALVRAVERRSTTLLDSAAVLVARQARFLEAGRGYLQPLSLEDVAADLQLHPSTVSRATSGRMIQTPAGTYPLRALFSRTVGAGDGSGVSQDRALRFVADTVAAEDAARPLSDDAIVARARAAQIEVSRRTVAKYRARLGIAASYRRRDRGDRIA